METHNFPKSLKSEKLQLNSFDFFITYKALVYFISICLVCSLIFTFLDYNRPEWRVFYILLIIVITWIMNYVDIVIVAFFPLILGPVLGIMPVDQILAQYFSTTTLLYTTAAIIGGALRKCGLDRRFALSMMRGSSHQMFDITWRFAIVGFLISNWISDTATMILLMPIMKRMLELVENWNYSMESDGKKDPRIFKPPQSSLSFYHVKVISYLVLSNSCAIGGPGTMIGATTNLAFLGQFQEYFGNNNDLTFATWFIYAWPLGFLLLWVGWFCIVLCWEGPIFMKNLFTYWLKAFYYKITRFDPNRNIPGVKEYIQRSNDALDKTGNWTFSQLILVVIFPFLIILLFTRNPGIPGFSGWDSLIAGGGLTHDSMVTCFFSILIFFIPFYSPSEVKREMHRNPINADQIKSTMLRERLLNWEEATSSVEWGIIWVFGGGYALASFFQVTGLDMIIANEVGETFSTLSRNTVLFLTLCVAAFATEFMSSTNVIAILTPIMISVSLNLKYNPLLISWNALFAGNCGCLFPISTTTNVLAYKAADITVPQMFKSGLLFKFLQIFIVFIFAIGWGEIIFNFSIFPQWAQDYIDLYW